MRRVSGAASAAEGADADGTPTARPRLRFADHLENTRWVAARIWRLSPGLVVALGGLLASRALAGPLLLLLIKDVVNSFSQGLIGGPTGGPWQLWALAGCVLYLSVAGPFERYLSRRLGDRLHIEVGCQNLEHAASLDIASLEDPETLDVMSRGNQGSAQTMLTLQRSSLATVTTSISLVAMMAILAAIEPLVLVLAAILPFYLRRESHLAEERHELSNRRTLRRRTIRYYANQLTSMPSAMESRLLELEPLLIGRFRDQQEAFLLEDRRLHLRRLASSISFGLLSTGAALLLIWNVAKSTMAGSTSVGALTIFAGAMIRMQSAIGRPIQQATTWLECSLAVANLRAFLEIQPQERPAQEPAAGRPVEDTGVASAGGAIEVDDLHFSYPGSQRPALRGVSFKAEAGEVVGLVGENGAGKSTLVKLLLRLYEPGRGCIRLGGVDLRELSTQALHRRLACLFQHVGAYHGTAADNVAFADWRRLLNDPSAIEEAGRRGGVEPLVRSLPDGYQTMLGRRFGNHDLSRGQWQRLALARALARDSDLLVLDEPSSSLDTDGEAHLIERIRQLRSNRITLVISHRLSTLAMADRILVLHQGELIEDGTHDELIARGGRYHRLWQRHAATSDQRGAAACTSRSLR